MAQLKKWFDIKVVYHFNGAAKAYTHEGRFATDNIDNLRDAARLFLPKGAIVDAAYFRPRYNYDHAYTEAH